VERPLQLILDTLHGAQPFSRAARNYPGFCAKASPECLWNTPLPGSAPEGKMKQVSLEKDASKSLSDAGSIPAISTSRENALFI